MSIRNIPSNEVYISTLTVTDAEVSDETCHGQATAAWFSLTEQGDATATCENENEYTAFIPYHSTQNVVLSKGTTEVDKGDPYCWTPNPTPTECDSLVGTAIVGCSTVGESDCNSLVDQAITDCSTVGEEESIK